MAKVTLFGVQGSAPSFSGELMLRHKAIRYRRIDLVAGWHRRMLAARGFPGGTVPALELDGSRIQTNRSIARALDERFPEPALFPPDPALRLRVEEAERLADELLQPLTRRLILAALARDPGSARAHRAIGKLPVPRGGSWLRARLMGPSLAFYGATEEQLKRDRRDLHPLLDELDGWLADGTLGGDRLGAADYQVAPLLAALTGVRALEDEVLAHPVAALPRRVLA